MSRLSDFYNDLRNRRFNGGSIGYGQGLWRAYQSLYDTAHGGEKYALSHVPFLGDFIRFRDDVQRYNDQYQRTGRDSPYAGRYSGADLPGAGGLSSAVQPVKMAKSLAKMYGAEVQLDIAKERTRGYKASQDAADKWTEYERLRQRRK